MQEEIFTPLGMQAATLGVAWTDDTLPPQHPVGHTLASGATVPVPKNAPSPRQQAVGLGSVGPAGLVVCNLPDWARFLHMHVTSDINGYLTAPTASRLQQPYPGSNYGHGIIVGDDPWATPGQSLFHNGNAWSQWASFWLAPARDFIIVAYTNCAAVDGEADRAMGDVYDLLISLCADAPPSGPCLSAPPEVDHRSLRVARAGPDVVITFDDSLVPGPADDFNVYRGALLSPFAYGHGRLTGGCGIPGPAFTDSGAIALSGDYYYLAVPACLSGTGAELEGSYGRDTDGNERPVAAVRCP
jgi:hypothetical protein